MTLPAKLANVGARFAAKYLLLISALVLFAACDLFNRNNDLLLSEEETLAVVNGKKIYLSEFQAEMRRFLDSFPVLKASYEKDSRKIKDIVINNLTEKKLLLQEAVRKRIIISEEDLEALSNSALNPYIGSNTELWLKRANLSSKEWAKEYHEMLIIQKLVSQEVDDKIQISNTEIKDYFDKSKNDFDEPLKYEVQHIMVSSIETVKFIERNLKNNADFEELVNAHSIAADKTNGGNLGFIEEGVMPYEINKAIFNLKRVNSISPITTSPHGFHLFKLLSVKKGNKANLKTSSEKIRKLLVEQQREEVYLAWLNKLKSRANITIDKDILYKDEGF